jgi:hypothetical protein
MFLKRISILAIILELSVCVIAVKAQSRDIKVHFKVKDKDFAVDSFSVNIIDGQNNEKIARFESRNGIVSLLEGTLRKGAYNVVIECREFRVYLDLVNKSLFENEWLIEIWRTTRVKRGKLSYVRAAEYRATFSPKNAEAAQTYYRVKE